MNQFHGEFTEEEALAKALAESMSENQENSDPTEKERENMLKDENKRSENSRKSLSKENNDKKQIKCLAPKCGKMFRAEIMSRFVF